MTRKSGGQNRQNGATGVLPPMTVELQLDSGIVIHVKPISPFTLKAIDDKAASQYPYPEEAGYEEVIPEDQSLGGATVIPADRNPEYQRLCEDINRERNYLKLQLMRDFAVSFPSFEDKRDVISHFEADIEQLATIMDIPEEGDKLWDFVWRHCVLASSSDQVEITMAVQNILPLTEAEISDKMRLFRSDLSREALRNVVARQARRVTKTAGDNA